MHNLGVLDKADGQEAADVNAEVEEVEEVEGEGEGEATEVELRGEEVTEEEVKVKP